MELLLIVLLSFGSVIAALVVGERLESRSERLGQRQRFQGTLTLSAGFARLLLREGIIVPEEQSKVAELLTIYMLEQNGLSVDPQAALVIEGAAEHICR